LSLNFRFRTGSATLDTRGTQDVERVIAFLSQPAQRARKVVLLGFADNQGGDRVNLELSQKRSQVVGQQLASRGVTAERVLGFGRPWPPPSNARPGGGGPTRRVEIWIR